MPPDNSKTLEAATEATARDIPDGCDQSLPELSAKAALLFSDAERPAIEYGMPPWHPLASSLAAFESALAAPQFAISASWQNNKRNIAILNAKTELHVSLQELVSKGGLPKS